MAGVAIVNGVFDATTPTDGQWNWNRFGQGALEGALRSGAMLLAAYTATGPISAITSTSSACYGNVSFGPFKYNVNSGDFSLSYGPVEYNISDNEFDYIFEKGNSNFENIMYGLHGVGFLFEVKNQRGSLFKVDQDKSFLGKAWQLTSRFTYEYLQTKLGMDAYALYTNLGGEQYISQGITFLKSDRAGSAFSTGHIVTYDPTYYPYLDHEFGHIIQSRILGPLYIPFIVVPSLFSASIDYYVLQLLFNTTGLHDSMPWEIWADKYQSLYKTIPK